MGITDYWLFVISTIVFAITPGIDTFFVLNKAIAQGRKAAIQSSLGITTGNFCHTIFAALGLSVIVAKSVTAFMIIKYAGAAYLLYLGIAKFFEKPATEHTKETQLEIPTDSFFKNYFSGLFTNLLNPKVVMFFMSFFPQFIKPENINDSLPYLTLGVTSTVLGFGWLMCLCFFAAAISYKLRTSASFSRWLNKISGLVFVLMGLKIAFGKK
ncbi:MAG: LysE family translocator [Bacteroidia bacterium]